MPHRRLSDAQIAENWLILLGGLGFVLLVILLARIFSPKPPATETKIVVKGEARFPVQMHADPSPIQLDGTVTKRPKKG